jgi:hypothetical protein
MKRYQWKWARSIGAPWWRDIGSSTLPGFPILPPALAARLLRHAGRCHDAGCTGSAEKCAACCGGGR